MVGIKAGKLAAADVDQLVSHGVDPEAVKYWKGLWKEVDGGSEFASELVKETFKAKAEEDITAHKVKLGRSYQLAYDMVARGLCGSDPQVVSAQVDEIMKYNDDAFDSLKKVVARHAVVALKKEAARIPNVGQLGSGEQFSSESAESDDLSDGLNRAFSNRRF